jgi:hypothetical protein
MSDWSKQSSVLETDGGSTRAEDFNQNGVPGNFQKKKNLVCRP